MALASICGYRFTMHPKPDQSPAPAVVPAAPAQAAGWSERGLGQNWQHRFFHRVIHALGKRPAYHVAYFVVFWYVLTSRSVRARTRFYLDRRFPAHRGFLRRFLDTYRLVCVFSQTLIDMAAVRILGPHALAVDPVHHDRFMQLCATESGVVLLNAHVGCWQVGLSTLCSLGKHACVVMIPEPGTQAFLDQTAASVIDPRTGLQSVLEITQALLNGQVVSLMGDRAFGDEQNVVMARFLGRDVAFPLAPYRVASATGAPIGVMMAPKVGFRSFEMRLVRVIRVPPNLGRNPRNYVPYAQQFADCLEQFVCEFPWQFYNFYDLWLSPTKGTP
jgi:predicted LPLAT superfamily acyltransferase